MNNIAGINHMDNGAPSREGAVIPLIAISCGNCNRPPSKVDLDLPI